MRQAYITKKFGLDAMHMITVINRIIADYEAEGYDLSLRQLYYQLVSRNAVPNTERSYKNIGNLVSDGRLAGLIDWEMIQDRGRVVRSLPHWNSPAEIIRSCAEQFRVDRWDNQPRYVEVMVEKQALEGVLIPVCQKWDVPFTANKGYSSSSALRDAGLRVQSNLQMGRSATLIYLGDHDPSGMDMSRDVEARIRLFSEADEYDDAAVTVLRVALNMDQVRRLRPPENPAKLTDSRASGYIEQFGSSSWELDAIEPNELASLVDTAISSIVDEDQWEASGEIQDSHRRHLLSLANKAEAEEDL